MERVRLLVLGTGSMARQHVAAFQQYPGSEVVAGADMDEPKLKAFVAEHGIARAFTSLEAALDWGGFDAVANVTPDAVHHPTTLMCLAAGKPVFCEKPLAETYADAVDLSEAAAETGLVNMVNLGYRTVPAFAQAAELVAQGAVGDVRHVVGSYLQSWLVGRHWGDWRSEARWLWRLSSAHGSRGTLGDIGIHILDAATLIAGAQAEEVHCRLATFPKAPGDRLGEYRLDANDGFVMSARLAGGALATIHATRIAPGHANAVSVSVYGTAGGLEAWYENERHGLRLCNGADVDSQTWREIECMTRPSLYHRFVEAVLAGRGDEPDFRRAADLQRVLDRCFESDGEATGRSV